MNIINIYENYTSYFNTDLKNIFELLSKVGNESNYKIYLIGGIVRDLLLNRPYKDIDITVEGDAITFAKMLSQKFEVEIFSLHEDFGTAKIKIENKIIDLASTRNETYPRKGHLPVVSEIGCALEKDVLRRDFTINSLALSLNKENFSDLIDYTGGLEDLQEKKIRILHDLSFVDDPTRILRALRYCVELGFEIEEKTFELQQKYLNKINYDMSYKRLKQEIKKTFSINSRKVFEAFLNQGIYKLSTLKEPLKSEINIEDLINKYQSEFSWLVYLSPFILEENDLFLDKIELLKEEKNIILKAKDLLNMKFKDDFEIYKTFSKQKTDTLLILAFLGRQLEVFRYLDNLKEIKLFVSGEDLINLGLKESKLFNEIFDCVLKEKLTNPKLEKADEIRIIKKHFTNR